MHHINLLRYSGPYRRVATVHVSGLLGPLWMRLFVMYARRDPDGAVALIQRMCNR